MNCPHCDNEIVDEDEVFCPKCGKPLAPEGEIKQNSIQMPQKRADSVLVAAMLTIISAVFMAGIGCIGVYQHQVLTNYYGSAPEFLGFLIFGVIDILFAAFALVGGMFMLKRKHLKISSLGIIFPLASVTVTFITILQYQYGFTDIILFSEISVAIFSLLSLILILKSRTEFTKVKKS